MNKPLPVIVELYDEEGNYSYFREELTLIHQEKEYAVLTHVDEYGHDLSDESTLFEITQDEANYTSYVPVEDDDLIAEIEQILNTTEAH